MKLTILSEQGKEAMIALLNAGDFVGEECVSTVQSFRSASATALSDCLLLRITKAEMTRVIREQPDDVNHVYRLPACENEPNSSRSCRSTV